MELNEIESKTRKALPEWEIAPLQLTLIEKGGSGRVFVRVVNEDTDESVIAMHYKNDRSDNDKFAPITDFLNRHSIPAPKILARDIGQGLLWVEDLGSEDLGMLASFDWEAERGAAYQKTLKTVFLLHSITEEKAPDDLPELEPPFDEQLYRWEQEYFCEQYLARFHSEAIADKVLNHPDLATLRARLVEIPRTLLHRDFQSTNVMLRDGETLLIDYQGIRWGVPEYDLASMVYDPYTEFTEAERDSMIEDYFQLKRGAGDLISREEYRERVVQCATQRLMQAMGAYGFLSEVKGKKEFLAHIPAAAQRLVDLSGKEGGIPLLGEILRDVK